MISYSEYFAAAQDAKDVVVHVDKHMQMWGANTSASSIYTAILAAYWRNTAAYYAPLIKAENWLTSLGYAGQQGELVSVTIPYARMLTRQFVSLVTQQRQSFDALTDVTDSNPLQTARLGKAIANQVNEQQKFDQKMEKAAERTAVTGVSYIGAFWESDMGDPYAVDENDTLVYTGDSKIETFDFTEVIYDWSVEEWNQQSWVLVRRKRNRWDLIAQHPELKAELLSIPSVRETKQTLPNFNFLATYENNDLIYVNEFYHKATPAVPSGRFTAYCNQDCILFDGENPYDGLPVEVLLFENILGTGLGYPFFSSLMPAQEMMNHSFSVISSNQAAFGVQSVLTPKGSNLSVEDVSGLKFIQYTPQGAEGGGKPEPLQLTATPKEIFDFTTMLKEYMSDMSLISEVLRGQPPANVSSGAMAATLSANSLEFLSSASKAVTFVKERVMNMVIKQYKTFASVEQIVNITGEGTVAYAKEFKADDLQKLKQIRIRVASPMLSSMAGRIQLADALVQAGMLQDPGKYYMILEGAAPETLFKETLSEEMAVQQEIDAILEGQSVMPLLTDNHPLFIKAYQQLLYNPQVRNNSSMYEGILQLCFERIRLEQEFQLSQPQLYAMLRGAPAAPPPGQPGVQPTGLGEQLETPEAQGQIAAPADVAPIA